MSSVYERITSALSSLGKRRERDSSAHDGASAAGGGPTSPSGGSATARTPKRFRPWEQADLHKRLETYKPLTWFGKPTSVGPVPCALKGWVNNGSDSLTCEYCGSKLVYPPHVAYDQRQAAAGGRLGGRRLGGRRLGTTVGLVRVELGWKEEDEKGRWGGKGSGG